MTAYIIGSVVSGILLGYFVFPPFMIELSSQFITYGLCVILFFVGIDMGRQGNVWQDIKSAGWRVLSIPVAVVLGTFTAAAITSIFLPFSVKDTILATSGFGWYSLAPMLLADYSATVSALAFLSNVMREVMAIVLIPIVATKIGYIETVSLPGACGMDTLLPVVVKATHDRIAIYSFVTGVVLSLLVPILIPAIVALPF